MEVRLVNSDEELRKVCEFRYRVYVDEMQLDIPEADHSSRIITDPFDKCGWVFTAIDGGSVVGTVRLNRASDLADTKYPALYRMPEFGPYYPDKISMTTRLIVASEYRNGPLGTRLARTGFSLYCKSGILFDNICCHPRQLAYFHRLGYRQFVPNFVLDGYGESSPLLLVVTDRDHFEKVRSPFCSVLPHDIADHKSVQFYHENIAQSEILVPAT